MSDVIGARDIRDLVVSGKTSAVEVCGAALIANGATSIRRSTHSI